MSEPVQTPAGQAAPAAPAAKTTITYSEAQKSLLDEVLQQYDDSVQQQLKGQIDTLVSQVLGKQVSVSKDVVAALKDRIAYLDGLLSVQVNAILHHPDYQKLEASWRGLHYLVYETETGEMLKLRVLNVTKQELYKDLITAIEFDQSQTFKKIYSPYDTYNAAPYGALVGDYEFDWRPQDVQLLEKMSEVAAAAHAPFISAASPKMFGWKSFSAMPEERDLAKIFDINLNPDYIKWAEFRKSDDARYVSLALPHVLMRLPYDPEKNPIEAFRFQEDVDGRDHSKYLWGSAAYALAARITAAFAEYGWHMAICGLEGGGQVKGLPLHTFETEAGTKKVKCPTEVIVQERRAGELIKLGMVPLVMYENTDFAVFVDAPSCKKPKEYLDEQASANEAISADLRCMLAASRFTHYLKAICRDKQGSFVSAKQLEDYLHQWIVGSYAVANADAKQAIKASRPLRDASVEVREIKGKPGYYAAKVFLAPHIPFRGLTAGVSMVAELPKAKG